MDLYWSPYTIRFENPFKEGATNDSASTQAINKIPSYLRRYEGTKVKVTFVSNKGHSVDSVTNIYLRNP